MTARRERFREVVSATQVDVALACTLVAAEVDPDLDVDGVVRGVDDLAASVVLPPGGASVREVAAALAEGLGTRGDAGDYADLRSSLLPHVLRRRRGLPLLLSVLWVEVAQRRDVPSYVVGLPGHVVVALGGEDDAQSLLVDPFGGGVVLRDPAQVASGPVTSLAPLRPVPLLARLLENVRQLGRRTSGMEGDRMQRWALELGLLLPGHAAPERSAELGRVLVRLGDYAGGARLLTDAAAALDDEDLARSARMATARLN